MAADVKTGALMSVVLSSVLVDACSGRHRVVVV